tara:strand:- start:568 stop:810 length:243 start_codon:yes stop_codon:yes gene_type:complete
MVFYIKDGVCKVTKRSNNGRDQIVKLIKKGNFIGEHSLISEEPSNLKATAVSDVQVCFIPKNDIIEGFEKNSSFTMSILQ